MDYLCHEWAGKPALVVSYGGRGGGKATAQLIQVCQGLRMRPMTQTSGYDINLDESGHALELDCFSPERLQIWEKDLVEEELQARFVELVDLMG